MKSGTLKLVITALMAAMTCIATMVIKFPSPTGYIHLGDGFVLLSGILLGPVYGGLSAGIGSMFADLFSGYAGYAPATLIIKALAAITGGLVFHGIIRIHTKHLIKFLPVIMAGICGGIVVTSGYFLFEGFLMGLGVPAALSGIPFNLIQNLFGVIVSAFLVPALTKIPSIKNLIYPI